MTLLLVSAVVIAPLFVLLMVKFAGSSSQVPAVPFAADVSTLAVAPIERLLPEVSI